MIGHGCGVRHSKKPLLTMYTLTTAPVLALFDPTRETVVSADASYYGLGAVLLQRRPDGIMKPGSYHSHSLSPTEQRYAQIQKGALAFT